MRVLPAGRPGKVVTSAITVGMIGSGAAAAVPAITAATSAAPAAVVVVHHNAKPGMSFDKPRMSYDAARSGRAASPSSIRAVLTSCPKMSYDGCH